MQEKRKLDALMTIRLIGASLLAIGAYLSAFKFIVAGGVLMGAGAILLAIGGK